MTLQKWMYASIIGAALAASILLGSVTWLVWQYRTLLDQASELVSSWTPAPDRLDDDLDAIGAAMPAPGSIDKLTAALTATTQSLAAVGPTITKAVGDTSTRLNKPCSGPDGPDACGTLGELNKAVIKAGDAIVTTQLEERKASEAVVTTMNAFAGDADDLAVDLKDPAIHNAAANLAEAEANLAIAEATGNGILLDVKKETDQMVAPKTRTQKVMGWMPTTIKLGAIGACLATGTPCP
jgi:hypothetical protein